MTVRAASITNIEELLLSESKESSDAILDYTDELLDDEILKEVRTICVTYLNNKSLKSIKDEELFIAYEFIVNKFNDIIKIKEAMKLNTSLNTFTEIAKTLDEITLSESITTKTEQYSTIKLNREINHVLNELTLYFGIINKIIKERNLEY